ncbi:Carboxylesterase, type B [Olavius sp. associated proteobacterium Delta 1]|nr:Carboxylesterase, type B [Olavius sp. associated proteobacterium Delta 1]
MKKNNNFIIAVIALVVAGLLISAVPGYAHRWNKRSREFPTTVITKYGKIQGSETDSGALAWKSVPFAQPPVGDLRWKAPEKPAKWHGVRDGSVECEPCTQLITGSDWIRSSTAEGSEDCLYLDIYRPTHKKKNLPVYVWIHGGSNNFGKAEDYDGSVLALKGDLVVVVIQYRLGPLGWLTHPALRHGDPKDDSGNFGTLDTIRALEWIKKNIKAFGGDPKKVTVTGESAGAHNVMNLVISPLAKGLFHRAMSQSGGMTTDTVVEGKAQAENTIAALLAADGLSGVPGGDVEAYLRGKTSHEIFEAYYALFGTLPTYDAYQDGYVLPGSVVATIRSGKYNKVPIIVGANEYETKAFMPLYGPAFGLQSWWDLRFEVLDGDGSTTLDDVLPTDFDKTLYEVTGYYGGRNWRAKFVDERARALREQQKHVFAYDFRWGGNSAIGSGPAPFDFIYAAGHAMEISFFFGADTSLWGYSFSPGNDFDGRMKLSDAMMKYMANFARTGKPKGHHLPKWKEWSNKEGKEKVIIFDADFDDPLIGMSDEEISIEGIWDALDDELATWDDRFGPGTSAAWGWLPWWFQWSVPE